MEGFTHDTREIDIQKLLMDTFDVKEKEFASIKKGQTCGYVRFHDKETAIKLVAKINEYLGKSEMFSVKGADIDFRILEGNEETVYLDHTLRQGLLYRWTEHSILPISTGGGLLTPIMLHKLTQSL